MSLITGRGVSSLGGLVLALGLSGCGSDPTSPDGPKEAQVANPPRVVLSDTGRLSADEFAVVRPFTTTEGGAFDVTVDWTFAANDIDVTIARGNCDFIQFLLQAILHECNIAATTESTTAKPETLHVASAPAALHLHLYQLRTGRRVDLVPDGADTRPYQLREPRPREPLASQQVRGTRAPSASGSLKSGAPRGLPLAPWPLPQGWIGYSVQTELRSNLLLISRCGRSCGRTRNLAC